jgi:TRAP-type C4-dicarboxylate transport system permease small subunit
MKVLQVVEKALLRCELVLVYTAITCAAVMMVLTTADAMSRYFLNSPIMGAYEVTEKYLMVASIFLGLSYACRGGAFIRVTFLIDRLPHAARLVVDYFGHLVSLAFGVVVVIATGQQALFALADATTLSTLPVPVGPAYCLVPIGFFAMTLLILADLPRVSKGESLLFTHDEPIA